MVIVAGHLTVAPQQRESYLASCTGVVEQARRGAGCLDFSISADLLDTTRVNVYERWESQAAVEAFRTSPGEVHLPAIVSMSVAEYEITARRPLSGDDGVSEGL